MKLTTIILLLALITINSSIQLQTLRSFIHHAYDTTLNDSINIHQWKNYFLFIQPQLHQNSTSIRQSFNFYDDNSDGIIQFQQILNKIEITNKIGPKQIHIGLTGKNNQMQVMWVTQPQKSINPVVEYGMRYEKLDYISKAQWSQYDAGILGFHGRIYKAVMINLVPRKHYFYRVGDRNTGVFSQLKYFTSPPNNEYQLERINFAVFGDMGTIMPFGYLVSNIIQNQNKIDPFDFIFHCGDIAYASTSSKLNQIEPIWDLFGQMTQKWASFVPYMPGVGNHQKFYNFTSYNHRYYLPRSQGSGENMWFSFDYAQLHLIHISSEHPYNQGTDQYKFIQNDLKRASQNKNTKWIILGVHRPFYAASDSCYNQNNKMVLELEQLIKKYKVDIVQTGHMHEYERTWPTYKGKAYKNNQKENKFIKPQAPIYVVQGTAGALINEKFIFPLPQWHILHYQIYGFGRITIKGNELRYQFLNTIGKIIDEWTIQK